MPSERRRISESLHGHAHAGVRLKVSAQLLILQRLALKRIGQVDARLAEQIRLQAHLQPVQGNKISTAMTASEVFDTVHTYTLP